MEGETHQSRKSEQEENAAGSLGVHKENESGEDFIEDSSRMSEKLYQNDELYLRNVLPEEMWINILDMVTEPGDLINFVNASPYFWELKREERVVFMFPKVMDILALNNYPMEFVELDFDLEESEEEDVEADDEEDEDGKENGEEENLDGREMDQVVSAEDDQENDMEDRMEDGDELIINEDGDDNEDDDLLIAEGDVMEDVDGVLSDSDEEGIDIEDDEVVRVARPFHELSEAGKWRWSVLNCRLVCSTWNKAVEDIYQQPLMTGIQQFSCSISMDPTSFENTMYNERSTWKMVTRFLSDVQKMLEQFEQSHASGIKAPPKNPMLDRYLILHFNDPHGDEAREFQEYLDTVTRFLTLFGHHVWYLHLSMYFCRFRTEQNYLKIREWLGLMPNLKFLRITGPSKDDDAALPNDLIPKNPLPKLEKLEVLVLRGTAGAIATELIRRNGSQVTFLKLRDVLDVDHEVVRGSLANLQCFSSCPLDMGPNLKLGDGIFENVLCEWKHLTTLTMSYWDQPFQPIFQLLETHFGDTLIDLCLAYRHNTLFEESKVLRLNLPKLRRLKLETVECYLLDFTLPMEKNLERLEIELWGPWARNKKSKKRDAAIQQQIIEFVGFEKKMNESNIWNKFDKLETIKIGTHFMGPKFTVYTRKGEKVVFYNKYLPYEDPEEFILLEELV